MSNTIPIKIVSLFTIATMSLFVSGQSILKGNIKWNPKWERKMFIQPLTDLEFDVKPADSIIINRDGSFFYALSSDKKGNLLYRLLLPPKNGQSNTILEGPAENTLHLYLPDKGITRLSADADSFYYSARIPSGGFNKSILQFREYKKPFKRIMEEVSKKVTAFPDSAEKFKSEIYEEWLNQIEIYKRKVKRDVIRSTEPPVILFGLYNYYMANLGRYDSSFFSQTINRINNQQLALVKKIREDLKSVNNNKIGMVFPGLLMNDENGNKKSLRDFKAKYYVLDFWASWCSPCRLSIRSHLPRLYNQIKDKNIALLGISVDDNAMAWKKAVQEDKPTWPQLHDAGQTNSCHEYFQLVSYPALLVLNENYEIIFETSSDFELEAYLKKLMK